jgi:hypothetical protein
VKVTHLWGLEGVLLCEGRKDNFRIISLSSFKITEQGNPLVLTMYRIVFVFSVKKSCV